MQNENVVCKVTYFIRALMCLTLVMQDDFVSSYQPVWISSCSEEAIEMTVSKINLLENIFEFCSQHCVCWCPGIIGHLQAQWWPNLGPHKCTGPTVAWMTGKNYILRNETGFVALSHDAVFMSNVYRYISLRHIGENASAIFLFDAVIGTKLSQHLLVTRTFRLWGHVCRWSSFVVLLCSFALKFS